MADYTPVLIYFAVILGFAVVTLFLARLLRPRKPEAQKYLSYECGEEPAQKGIGRFHVGFYLVALLFVIFDVEVVFLFPWAVCARQLGLVAFIEIVIFLGVLFLGWIYAYNKKALEWK